MTQYLNAPSGFEPLPLTLVLKPVRSGLIVRDPKTGEPLRENGQPKTLDSYWRRRLRDGDVEVVTSAKKAAGKKATD